MAKINITGNAIVITSAMKLEELRAIAKYRPDALTLKGGEDGKEPLFAVSVTEGNGSISKYGAAFGSATRDDSKLAVITMLVDNIDDDVKEFVADKYGAAITYLDKLEEVLPCIAEEIAAEKAAVIEAITVVQ